MRFITKGGLRVSQKELKCGWKMGIPFAIAWDTNCLKNTFSEPNKICLQKV